MKYCILCQKYVDPVKSKWNWGWFIILCFTVVGGIGYAVYHAALKSKEHCPICNTKKLVEFSPEDIQNTKAKSTGPLDNLEAKVLKSLNIEKPIEKKEKAEVGNGPLDNLEAKVLKALNIEKPLGKKEKAEVGNGPLDNLEVKVLKALNIEKTVK